VTGECCNVAKFERDQICFLSLLSLYPSYVISLNHRRKTPVDLALYFLTPPPPQMREGIYLIADPLSLDDLEPCVPANRSSIFDTVFAFPFFDSVSLLQRPPTFFLDSLGILHFYLVPTAKTCRLWHFSKRCTQLSPKVTPFDSSLGPPPTRVLKNWAVSPASLCCSFPFVSYPTRLPVMERTCLLKLC